MTIQELYSEIGGDHEQALRVLRVDKLIDKHIRKLPKNGVADALIEAGKNMEPEELFEKALGIGAGTAGGYTFYCCYHMLCSRGIVRKLQRRIYARIC